MENASKIFGKMQYLVEENNNPKPKEIIVPKLDSSDKLRKLKKLMDDGIITPEELEVKKKQLLGI